MSEETYSFLCPSCSAHLSVPVSVAGVSGPCPYCASTITSPMPDQVPLEDMIAIEEAMANEVEVTDQAPVYPPVVDPHTSPSSAPAAEQPRNAPAGTSTASYADAGIGTAEAEPPPTEPERRGGRKKRGERVPKGKQSKRKNHEARPERRKEAPPRPASPRAAAVVNPASDRAGLSLFAKACLGIAGVALVALGAVYGLPMIMGDHDKDPISEVDRGSGAELLNPPLPATQGAGMTPAVTAKTNDPLKPESEPIKPKPVLPEATAPEVLDPPLSSRPGAPAAFTDTTLPASMTTYTPATDSILFKPRQVLDKFLAAPNWKERLKYVTGGQALSSEMRSYYTQYPDGPLDPVSVNWTLNDTDPDGKTEIFVFTTSFDIDEDDGLIYLDFPTVVEGRDENYTVNWHSFVEFKDRHLHQFVTKRAFDTPQNFHIIAVRAHYFGSDAELKTKVDSGEFVCIRANSPNPDDGTQAFLSTQNKSGQEMAAGLLWEKAAGGQFDTPLVELCWKKTGSGTPYVEVTKVLGDKWRDTPK